MVLLIEMSWVCVYWSCCTRSSQSVLREMRVLCCWWAHFRAWKQAIASVWIAELAWQQLAWPRCCFYRGKVATHAILLRAVFLFQDPLVCMWMSGIAWSCWPTFATMRPGGPRLSSWGCWLVICVCVKIACCCRPSSTTCLIFSRSTCWCLKMCSLRVHKMTHKRAMKLIIRVLSVPCSLREWLSHAKIQSLRGIWAFALEQLPKLLVSHVPMASVQRWNNCWLSSILLHKWGKCLSLTFPFCEDLHLWQGHFARFSTKTFAILAWCSDSIYYEEASYVMEVSC